MNRADRKSGRAMSRGRGRPPHRMFEEGAAIAAGRGSVIPVPGGRSDAFDLIICEEFRNVFVRFRWSGAQYISSREVLGQYRRDIARIARMPLTAAMAWEFWLREPRGKWQFFLVTHDSIVEIRQDGTILYRAVLPVPAADTAGEGESSGDDGDTLDGDPDSTSGKRE
jgi:hypothetical protein